MAIEAYRSVINTLEEASLLLTGQGQLLAMNPSAATLLALQDGAWIGQNLQHFLASPANTFRAFLTLSSRSRQPVVGAFSLNTTTGVRHLRAQGAVLTPRQAQADSVLIVRLFPKERGNSQFTALTERIAQLNEQIIRRQRVEYDLREQKEWLQVTLTSIGDAVIIADRHGVVTFINPIAEKMTGWDTAAALGRPLSEIFIVVHENTRLPVRNPVERVLEEDRIVKLATDTVLISRGGAEFPIADTAAPIYHNNNLEGVVLVFHDVTMKRNLERELLERAEKSEEENRQKNMFLSILAHELRNPIGPISNAIQLLKMGTQSQLALEILERQTRHLANLINGLLDVARITGGKLSLQTDQVDFRKLVQEQCIDLENSFTKKNIQLKFSYPNEPLLINGDPTRLTQVVGNLLSNAEKFTPAGGMVTVALEKLAHDILLSVADSGPGIDEALIPSLFSPFVQGRQGLARTQGGLGMGLAMVKGIVDLHGGQVAVRNQEAGGTIFSITLPRISAATAAHSDVQSKTPGTRSILLIEDNHDQAHSMCLLLEELGGIVHLAYDGVQGVQMATALMPDIVICDIGLPIIDGFEVARRLRSNQAMSTSVLIALTGYGEADFVENSKLAGFDHHYLKPMNLEDINRVLAIPAVSANS